MVEEDRERARRGHRRILLAHRPRRRVPRVGEDGLAGFLQARIEAGEGLARHVDLPAYLELARALQGARERGRDRLDRAQVLADVLPDAPVAARGAPDEAPALVEQGHPEAVDLGLADVLGGEAGLSPPDPRLELLELLHGHRVVQREHGHEVLDRREGLRPPPPGPLGRAVRRDQLRVRLLERHQLAPEPVVLGVADLGAVLRVVEVVVPVDLLTQLVEPRADVGRAGHGGPQDNNRPRLAPSPSPFRGEGRVRGYAISSSAGAARDRWTAPAPGSRGASGR